MESRFVSSRGWRRFSALVATMALVSAGCVGATATGSPSPLPAASPKEAASATASASGSASPAATLAAIDLSNVPLAPSGTWKSIRWVSVSSPFLGPVPSGVETDVTYSKVAGWSRGFVAFSLDTTFTELGGNGTTTTTTTYSSDGVHWHAGAVFQQHPNIDNMDIRGVFEGPDGLLAVEESGACGDSWVEGLLTSSDGITWQAVDMQKAFGNAVIWNVSGGSKGFVATDTIGQAVWTSRDGQSWQPVKLDTPAFALSRIDDGTAFSAGYVLAGSTELTGARSCGATIADPSAEPSPTPPLRVPAVWWSSDGANWVKAELPGAKAAYPIQMRVSRLDDHTLAAFDSYGYFEGSNDGGEAAWVSRDGQTWTPLAQPAGLDPMASFTYNVQNGLYMTDGRHGIQLQAVSGDGSVEHPYAGGLSLSTWTDGGLVPLVQSGDQPSYDFRIDWAVGPTGVVVTDAGQLWIGLPSSV
jgi:hypothetical protein